MNHKKKGELMCAGLLLNKLNLLYKFDYEAIPNINENLRDAEIDVYGVSKSGKYERLNLQIKIIDTQHDRDVAEMVKAKEKIGITLISSRYIEPEKWAVESIEKYTKKYGPDVRSSLILVLCVYYAGALNEDYAKIYFNKYTTSDFKGIYYIDLPHPKEGYYGQIITIK